MFTADPQVDFKVHKEALKAGRHIPEKHRQRKPMWESHCVVTLSPKLCVSIHLSKQNIENASSLSVSMIRKVTKTSKMWNMDIT